MNPWKAIFLLPICLSTATAQTRPVAGQHPTTTVADKFISTSVEPTPEGDRRQEQVQAATANGAAALREQILRMQLTREVQVRDLVDKTRTADRFAAMLEGASPVGGPRWVDEQTCQVKLEISGSAVAGFIQTAARENPDTVPVRPAALAARLPVINRMKFSAVGSSAGGATIENARPHYSAGKWSEINEHARRQAVAAAQANAVNAVIESLRPVPLRDTVLLGDAMKRPVVVDRVRSWLSHQPVTKIEFLTDLKVSVTVTLSPKTLARVVKSATAADAEFARDFGAIDWEKVKASVEQTSDFVVGTATAAGAPPSTLPAVVLPLQPPEWVDQQLTAEATAHAKSSQLKTGHAAESDAIGKISEQFLSLRLGGSTTLGDAAKSDPHLAGAVERVMRLAHTDKTDYQLNGDVRVKVSLDLHDAWDELRGSP